MAVSKINGYRAPYTSSTFRSIVDSQSGRSGLLELSGVVSHTVAGVLVPPFKVIQNGLIYSKDLTTTVTTPTMAPPYYVVVSSPTPTNIDNLIFSYAKGPADVSSEEVLIASYDGTAWRTMPIISIDGVIEDRYADNIDTGRVGPYSGLQTTLVGTDYVTSGGVLIDKTGQRQIFTEDYVVPVVLEDPDYIRVDRILYRRPSDSERRIGYRKLILGGTYSPTPAATDKTTLFNSGSTRNVIKTLITSDNSAHILCTTGTGGSYDLCYSKVDSIRGTVLIPETTLVSSLSDIFFDAVADDNNIHIVYASSGNIVYQKIDGAGSLIGSAIAIDTQTGTSTRPKITTDTDNFRLYIVYQSSVGAVEQIFFASRDVANGDAVVTSKQITEPLSPVNNMVTPDLFIDDDYLVHVTWENLSATSVQYQVFDDIGNEISAVKTLSAETTYGSGILSHGAKDPKVMVSDNRNVFVAFRQAKGGGEYGIAVWTSDAASMSDFFAPVEDFGVFDFHVEPIFNDLSFILGREDVTSVDLVKMHAGEVSFVINLDVSEATHVGITKDKLGSFYHAWTTALGGFGAKTPSQSIEAAYSFEELDGDILLARVLPPGNIILNWISGGRPGSFFDFITAYGSSVTIGWEETTPNTLSLGTGPGSTNLKVIDLFTNINYTIASGNYVIQEGEALFASLNGVDLVVTPEARPIVVLPWGEDIAVLGMNKGGEFNPVLLGVAGMEQLDSGESIIFGEDLPQSIRGRLGIISETAFQAYTSTLAINVSDTYPQALSNLDIMAAQNRHIKLVRYSADWGVSGPNVLRLLTDCYVQIPGLSEARNTIAAQSLTLDTDGQIAYVNLNRVAGGAAYLTVTVALASAVIPTRNTFIVARRIGTNIEIDGQAFSYSDRISTGQINNIVRDGDSLETAIKSLDVREDVVKRVSAITRTYSSLPTGSSCTIDGVVISNGSKVLFAHASLNGIYKISGVGSSILWTKLYEFAGSQTPSINSCVLVTGGGDINRTLWSYDSLKGWYRLSTLDDYVEVRAADFTTTTLPSGGGPLVVDGVTINEGELVLYGNAAINRVYRVTGIGTTLAFEALNIFSGLVTPKDGNLVLAQDGSVSDTIWEFNEDLPGWGYLTLTSQNKTYLGLSSPTKSGGTYVDQILVGQLNNFVQEGDTLEEAIKRLDIRSDVLKKARVVSTTATTLPPSTPLVVDGKTIVNGDVVLFANIALDGLYKAAISGGTITWTKLYAFGGSRTGARDSLVYVYEGLTDIALWGRDQARIPPWYKVIDPSFNMDLYDTVVRHTSEINDLQNSLAAIIDNRPNFEIFPVVDPGGQKIFTLTKFTVSPDNTLLDVYVMWNGRWQSMSKSGDFSDGQFVKLSATQIEMAEFIPDGQELEVFMWDPAALLVRTAKEQKFTAGVGGQSIFTLDPLIFTLDPDNTVIDAEYYFEGRWQHQSLLGDFSDGAVRKNTALGAETSIEIETSIPLAAGTEIVIIRRVPVGGSAGSGGGGGGSTVDLTNITTSLGFSLPNLTVGTPARPASALILRDKANNDVWELAVDNGFFRALKVISGAPISPASSFIMQDKANADIWELEVNNGVVQVIKII